MPNSELYLWVPLLFVWFIIAVFIGVMFFASRPEGIAIANALAGNP